MPPGAQLPPGPGQLPVETAGFVGRVSEMAMLNALLASGRLVTVTGPGGVGKTRLALRAAAAARPSYRHGAVLADLAEVRDPGLLPRAVAAALRLPPRDDVPDLHAVIRRLRGSELLLILDTCEHLVDAAALFAENVLRDAPGVTVLATSRQPLDVAGESTCPLGGLPPADAEELFERRAEAVMPGFAVTGRNRDVVPRLCRRLDGLPLAIELAAVRMRALDPAQLADRMDGALSLLSDGRRGTASRHRALRDSIGWSYDLCTRDERVLWARLSVFEGPLTLSAAEEVCAGGPLARPDVLEALIGLVDKSVVAKMDDGRYRMTGTTREYGAQRLAASPGEEDRVRGLLLHRYLRLATEFDADPLTDQLPRYQALRAEHDSIRAALRHGFSVPGAASVAARLVTALYWYWHFAGLVPEAKQWLALTLEKFPGGCAERASALILRGAAAAADGDVSGGLRDCEAGLSMARAAGDTQGYARGHLYYCQALIAAGRDQEAVTAGRAAARLMPAAGDSRASGLLGLYLALAHGAAGDFARARDEADRGLSLLPDDPEERWARSVLYGLTGLSLFMAGEQGRGSAALRQSLMASRALGDPVGLAYGLGLLGFAAVGQGRHARAAWLLGAVRPLRERCGDGAFLRVPGIARLAQRAADEARENLGDSVFGEVVEAASRCPLSEAVDLAVADSDDIPALAALEQSGSARPGPGRGSAVTESPSTPLTARQLEIAALAAAGLSNREIADRLVISKRTVDTHLSHIFGKLGVTSREQVGAWFHSRQRR